MAAKDKRRKKAPPVKPAPNLEAMVQAARQERVSRCEAEVQKALQPILARYKCRLGTVQTWVDGQPAGPGEVRVFALD